MSTSRRQFCRALGSLACLGVGGCKIEPRVDIHEQAELLPARFPDLPAQIPDQLESADHILRVLSEAMLERELPLLESGLRERPPEDREVVMHFVALMRSLDLSPAANRGGWLQPVALELVEPTGAAVRVALRPESEAPASNSTPAPKPDPSTEPPAALQPEPEAPPDPAPRPERPAPDPATDPTADPTDPTTDPTPPPLPSRALALAELGAFRQRSAASPHLGLPLSPVLELTTPLPSEAIVGRVAVFRAAKDFDPSAGDASARVDLLMAAVRDAGAIGCLLLTRADEAAIEQFRLAWSRQIRRAGASSEALLIEGIVGDGARKEVQELLGGEDTWVLDLDLGMRDEEVESSNIIGRVTGRDRPNEAVVLTCNWDTAGADPLANRRLLTTLLAFHQLVEWSRRSTPPRYSLVLLLTVDAGLSAGHAVHAGWSADYGAETQAIVALSRPSPELLPAVELSGRYDAGVAELTRRVVAADSRDLLLVDQLAMPSLAPYLRYPAPLVCVGAPDPEALDDRGRAEPPKPEPGSDSGEDEEVPEDPNAGLFADVRLLRNLVLALAAGR